MILKENLNSVISDMLYFLSVRAIKFVLFAPRRAQEYCYWFFVMKSNRIHLNLCSARSSLISSPGIGLWKIQVIFTPLFYWFKSYME